MLDWLIDIILILLAPAPPTKTPPGKFPVPPKRIEPLQPVPEPSPRVRGPEITPKEREATISARPEAYAASQLLPVAQRQVVETLMLHIDTGKWKRWTVRYDVFAQWVVTAVFNINALLDAQVKSQNTDPKFGANAAGWGEVVKIILDDFARELRNVERLAYRMSHDQPVKNEAPPLTRVRKKVFPRRVFPGPFGGKRM